MNKEQLLKELRVTRDSYDIEDEFRGGVRTGLSIAIFEAEQLDEPEKVVIPQFVANYIELCKGENGDRQAYTEDNSELWFALNGDIQGMPNSVSDWLFNEEKVEAFARAWLDGYEIEKEKLYRVIIPTKDKLFKYYYLDGDGGINMVDKLESVESHTEEFIRFISDDLWQFAVEVMK